MAVTRTVRPAPWSRVGDTNRMIYKYSSDNYTEPNFQFQMNLKMYDAYGVETDLGSYNLQPTDGGTVEFNPSSIYRNYLGYDFDISRTGLTEMFNTIKSFRIYCYEYYGTPPIRQAAYNYEFYPMQVYNGCQQIIPYDYAPLNVQSNLKWVMGTNSFYDNNLNIIISGNTGQYLTDMTEFKMDNDEFAFLYALGSYPDGRPDKIRYTISYLPPAGISGITTTMKFMNMDVFSGNTSYAMLPVPTGTTMTIVGGYIEVWEDGTTFANLMPTTWTWTKVSGNAILKFKNCWMTYGIPYYPTSYTGIKTMNKDLPSYEQSVANASVKSSSEGSPFTKSDTYVDDNYAVTGTIYTLPRYGHYTLAQGLDYWVAVHPDGFYREYVQRIGDETALPTPDGYQQLDDVNSVTGDYKQAPGEPPFVIEYDNNVNFGVTTQGSLGYYVPCGPYQAINQSKVLSAYTNSWLYYYVDLIKGSGVTEKVLNTYPVRFTNECHNTKFERWELFWLNPHGGFDAFTFNKVVDVDFKIKRDTYKRKPSSSFSTYEAGERVFNTDVTEEVTLRSRLLTQKESQLMIQLIQSPVVYVNKYYEYNGVKTYYPVPYIIVTDTIKYEQKNNVKEIFYEIKLRPSNQKVIQHN